MLGTPYIPETITVHLGTPDSDAANVTVPFVEYIKNVVASEIYPTWPESSLRANLYAIISFALNRVYTEWYRSRGYPFDITNSTQFDQTYIQGRDTFSRTDVLAEELFNDYIRRQGAIEPLFASFCNGTTVTCDGLSQWGTVGLAEQGFIPYDILTYYYGDNIDLVIDAPVQSVTPSYPGRVLREGDTGNEVRTIQVQLNRIGRNYPAIPIIAETDGIFGAETTDAVKQFQQIFNLTQSGTVDKATWYKIAYIFSSVKKLAELASEGVTLEDIKKQFSEELRLGMQGTEVSVLQYYLAVVGAYYAQVQPVDVTGYFGEDTDRSVKSFQRVFGLPQTGVVDRATWNALYEAYEGIVQSLPAADETNVALFPGTVLKEGMTSPAVRTMQEYLSRIHQAFTAVPAVNNTGYFGPLTKASVLAFQRQFGLDPTGIIDAVTWDEIAAQYSALQFGYDKRPYQYPGYIIK